MSLDATKTRTQDVRNLYRFYTSTALGRMVTLQFLLTNWVEINNRYTFHIAPRRRRHRVVVEDRSVAPV